MQKSMAEQKAEAATAQSQMQARLEKVQILAAEKTIDRAPTASIKPSRPLPKPQPTTLPAAFPMGAPATSPRPSNVQLSPGLYRAFVLRDVEHGRAVVEGAGASKRSAPATSCPAARGSKE